MEAHEELSRRLEELVRKQKEISREIDNLRTGIESLKKTENKAAAEAPLNAAVQPKPAEPATPPVPSAPAIATGEMPAALNRATERPTIRKEETKPLFRSNLEKFIGENLISKIGIAVLVIGVGIGVKYAIDHNLISPWMRIFLGYLTGIILAGFAIRLRKKYNSFSAVLLSGAMAIFYFITFAAYDFYGLIPVFVAFILMVLFTILTVGAAVTYDRQVIAHFGLVGAYAVPFLLDDGTGRVVVMFTYMAFLNAGILAISFVKSWKPLFYSAFVITWLIFFTWYISGYRPEVHFTLALIFISIFFLTFDAIFIAFRISRKEVAKAADLVLLAVNAAILFGAGYLVLLDNPVAKEFRGLFTLICALVQGAVAWLLKRNQPADLNAFILPVVLSVLFLTIAIPVQWDGRWVTLLWSAEMVVLFFIGRTRGLKIFEVLSYPLMVLVFFSLVNDWSADYMMKGLREQTPANTPVFNICFLSSLLVTGSFGAVNYFNRRKELNKPFGDVHIMTGLMDYVMPILLVTTAYLSLVVEINAFWNRAYFSSVVTISRGLTFPQYIYNANITSYSYLSLILYSLLFFLALSWINLRLLKEQVPGLFSLGLNVVGLIVFLVVGIYTLGVLRDSYLDQEHADLYYRGFFLIGVRYVSFAVAGMVLWTIQCQVRWAKMKTDFRKEFDFLLHITLLTAAANELINWMDLYRPGQSYKLALSILFGVYALMMLAVGILRRKFHLRIGALILFGATLLKLLIYDITYLNTISKTIVFITLGVLLLVSGFLYTRYRKQIFGDHEEKPPET